MVAKIFQAFELKHKQLRLLNFVLVDFMEFIFFCEYLLGKIFFLLVQEWHFNGDIQLIEMLVALTLISKFQDLGLNRR